MVTITRFELNKCKFDFQTDKESRIIDSVLKFWIDGAIFSEKYKKGYWDGFYRFYDKNNNFDFGLLSELIYCFEKNNVKYNYLDNYVPDYRINKIKIKILEGFDERDYQNEAVYSFFEDNIGIIIVPTRGGKTFISSQCVIQINERHPDFKSLFIVDSIDLFSQTVTEFSKFLNIDESEIGKINSDKIELKTVTIAMAQTLTSIFYGKKKNLKLIRELNKYLCSVKFLCVDEIQDNSSDTRINVYKKCKNVDFVLGLSATPFKQMDIMSSLKVKGFFGDICYEVRKKRLQKEGYLSLDKAILISNEAEAYGLAESYAEFLKLYIHENEKRNAILLNVIQICLKNNWKTLLLFNSKYHGRLISDLSGQTFIDGDSSKSIRNIEKDNFLSKKGGVLLASNIFKKGITLPEVEICFIADGGLEGTNIIQKFGRMLGVTENKKHSIVIDIMDVGNKYFSEHSLNRLEIYDQEIGKKRIEIYESKDLFEIEETIKDWLNVNK
jgi:superfamily II DNA or RNA helicase